MSRWRRRRRQRVHGESAARGNGHVASGGGRSRHAPNRTVGARVRGEHRRRVPVRVRRVGAIAATATIAATAAAAAARASERAAPPHNGTVGQQERPRLVRRRGGRRRCRRHRRRTELAAVGRAHEIDARKRGAKETNVAAVGWVRAPSTGADEVSDQRRTARIVRRRKARREKERVAVGAPARARQTGGAQLGDGGRCDGRCG